MGAAAGAGALKLALMRHWALMPPPEAAYTHRVANGRKAVREDCKDGPKKRYAAQ